MRVTPSKTRRTNIISTSALDQDGKMLAFVPISDPILLPNGSTVLRLLMPTASSRFERKVLKKAIMMIREE